MKAVQQLFGHRGPKQQSVGPLTNKTVQVGSFQVICEALLGSGGYADIYRVTDISSGHKYALKHLRLAGDVENIQEVQREAKTMAKLRGHPNILRLHAVAFAGPKGNETDGFFLLDFCPGTLLDLLQRHNFQLEEATVLHIFHCVSQAVAHMHRQRPPMAHRDLKAENVLMLPDGTWVLCDFGSATTRCQVYETAAAMTTEEEVIRKHTTPAYRPPEMWDLYMRQMIDTKVDIWALGVLLFVLCFGRLPFSGDSKLQILNAKYEMPSTRPPQLRALIRAMLTMDPAQRPAIDLVLHQLEQAAIAITGRALSAAAAASSTQPRHQPAPQPAVQQSTRQHLQAQAATPGFGSFWGTADALGASKPAAGAAVTHVQQAQWHAASSITAGSSAPVQQIQQQQTDRASFTPVAAVLQPGAATATAASGRPSSSGVDSSSRLSSQAGGMPNKRSPPLPPAYGTAPAAIPQHVSAASDIRAHALMSPQGTPLHGSPPQGGFAESSSVEPSSMSGDSSSVQQSRLSSSSAGAAIVAALNVSSAASQGNPFAAMRSAIDTDSATADSRRSAPQQQQQQQHGPDLGRLADITARAAAAAAIKQCTGEQRLSAENQQGQVDSAAEPQTFAIPERRPQPYSSTGGSTSSSSGEQRAATGSTAAPAAPAATVVYRSRADNTGSSGAIAANAAGPVSVQGGKHQHHQLSIGLQDSTTTRSSNNADAAPVGVICDRGSSMYSGQPPSMGSTYTAICGSDAEAVSYTPVNASSLADLKAHVFAEINLLRVEVRSLSDQNQAFVFRIKQLEEYTVQQREAMAKMQQQVAALQQAHRSSSSDQAGTAGAAAAPSALSWLNNLTHDGAGQPAAAGTPVLVGGGQPSQPSAHAAGSFWATQ